jgi:hypothetical protein
VEAGLCDRVPVVLRIALLEGRRKTFVLHFLYCIGLASPVAGVGVLERMEDGEPHSALADEDGDVSDDEHAHGGAGGSSSGAGGSKSDGGEMEAVFVPDGLSPAGIAAWNTVTEAPSTSAYMYHNGMLYATEMGSQLANISYAVDIIKKNGCLHLVCLLAGCGHETKIESAPGGRIVVSNAYLHYRRCGGLPTLKAAKDACIPGKKKFRAIDSEIVPEELIDVDIAAKKKNTAAVIAKGVVMGALPFTFTENIGVKLMFKELHLGVLPARSTIRDAASRTFERLKAEYKTLIKGVLRPGFAERGASFANLLLNNFFSPVKCIAYCIEANLRCLRRRRSISYCTLEGSGAGRRNTYCKRIAAYLAS